MYKMFQGNMEFSGSDQAKHSALVTFAINHPDVLTLNHGWGNPHALDLENVASTERAVFSLPADLYGLCFLKSSFLLTSLCFTRAVLFLS